MMFWNPQTTTRVIRLSVLAVLASLMFWGPTSSETLSEDILPDAQAPTKDSPQASKDNTTKTTIGGSTQPATTPASAPVAEETDQPVQSSRTSRASTETKQPTTSTDTGQRLRAGDTLQISFYETLDIAPGSGDETQSGRTNLIRTFYQRIDLSGEYNVDANGNVEFPRLGAITVDGLRTGELREVLAKRFKQRMLREGDVNVTILRRQPIYVIGLAKNSGAFPIVPDMMVLHALALAGGLDREQIQADQLSHFVNESTRLSQSKQSLARLIARRAAIQSTVETVTDDNVTPSKRLISLIGLAQARAVLQRELRLARDARTIEQRRRLSLVKARDQAEQRVKMLEKRKVNARKETDMLRSRMDSINSLLQRGVLSAQRTVTAQANYFQSQSRYDDIETQRQGASFALAQAEREIENFEVEQRAAIAKSLADLTNEVADGERNVRAVEMTQAVLRKSHARSNLEMADVAYQIVRRSRGKAEVIDAVETTALEPGDVLRITARKPSTLGQAAAIGERANDLVSPSVKVR